MNYIFLAYVFLLKEEEEPSEARAENEPNQDKDISYTFTAPDFKPIPAHPLRIFVRPHYIF